MTIWEKVIVNVEKGARKTLAGAALFSERVKAEIALARLRIRADELRAEINEQYRVIGRKIVTLNEKDAMPRTTDLLLQDEEIAAALSEIATRQKDLEELYNEIAAEKTAIKDAEKSMEEKAA